MACSQDRAGLVVHQRFWAAVCVLVARAGSCYNARQLETVGVAPSPLAPLPKGEGCYNPRQLETVGATPSPLAPLPLGEGC